MIDIHTHILPEVDDGARSWEMAVRMCHLAAEDGIEHLVATPHASPHFPYDRPWLRTVLDELRRRVGPQPALSLGCDFHVSIENLDALAEDPHRFTIESTPYLLIELSNFSVPPTITATFEEMLARGLVPIITHPERNPLLQENPGRILEWASLGCPVQVTASAITGQWGARARDVARGLLDRRAVHLLASDCHNLEGRPPGLSAARDAVAAVYGAEIAQALVSDNPRAIVSGQPLAFVPVVRE